jgi:hypothetical protein
MLLPKLEVAGSSPVSRSMFAISYENLSPRSKAVNGLSEVSSTRKALCWFGLCEHVQLYGLDDSRRWRA